MATNNETVAEAIVAVRKMIHDCPAIKGGLGELRYQLKANGAINIIEEAHDREIKALEWKIENYAKVVECKDREIKAKDAEIAELREYLKEACAAVCSGGLVGCKGTLAYGSKCCLSVGCEYHKWRKALGGADSEGK